MGVKEKKENDERGTIVFKGGLKDECVRWKIHI